MRKIFKHIILIYIALILVGCASSKTTTKKNSNEYTSKQLTVDGVFLDACTQKELGNYNKAIELYDQVIALNPSYSAAYFDKASILFHSKEINQSIVLTNKAISLQPKNIWYRLQLVQIYLNISDYANVAKTYEELIKLKPEEIEYYQELAEIYNKKGDETNMLKIFDRMEKRWGINEDISMFKFHYFMEKKEYAKAEDEIKKLQINFPSQTSYLAILAEIYMKKNDYPKALEYYKQIEQINPTDPYINVSLANLYLVQKDKPKTYEYLTKAFANHELDYQTKIQILLTIYAKTVDNDAEDFNRFFTLLQILSEQYPEEKTVWELLSTGYMKSSQFDKAKIAIKKAISIGDSSNGKKPNDYELYQNLLFAESTLNQTDTLIEDAKTAIELFPEQPVPYLFLGVNYLSKNDYAKAKKALEQGLKLVVDDKSLFEDFYSNLGEACYKLDIKEEAYKYFDKTLVVNPENYMILNNYAYYLSIQNTDLEKAQIMGKKVYDKYPNNPTYVDTYAWVLYTMKNYKAAYDAMQSIISQKDSWTETIKEHYELILKELNR